MSILTKIEDEVYYDRYYGAYVHKCIGFSKPLLAATGARAYTVFVYLPECLYCGYKYSPQVELLVKLGGSYLNRGSEDT